METSRGPTRSRSGMKSANKIINTTDSALIRDEIFGARRSHDDNYHRRCYTRLCIGNYESFLQPFERARNIQTHVRPLAARRLSLDLCEWRNRVL